MFGYLGWAMAIALCVAVDISYGPIGETRLFGVFFVIASVHFISASELPFHLGEHRVVTLTGWQKAFLLLPCMGFGCLWIVYAAEITCSAAKYKHLCA